MTLFQRVSYIIFPDRHTDPVNKAPMNTVVPDLCLEKYENRNQYIQNSTEPIEGIFFIYQNNIIPDYYTECLESESVCMNCYRSHNDIRRQMYLLTFHQKYMTKKFPELKYYMNEKALPRGRTSVHFQNKVLFLDECYVDDTEMIEEIFNLYRLPHDTMIIPHYNCLNCN